MNDTTEELRKLLHYYLNNPEWRVWLKKNLIHSVTSKILCRLLILAWFFLFDLPNNPAAKLILRRYIEEKKMSWLKVSPCAVIEAIKVKDIMELFKVSRRVAVEYKQFLFEIAYLCGGDRPTGKITQE